MNIFKKILHTLYSFVSAFARTIRDSSIHVRTVALLLVCAIGVGVFLYGNRATDQTFSTDYAIYADIAAQADNAAYVPGAQSNPVRVALDQALTQILEGTISDSERLTLANEGLTLVQQSEDQIGDISSTSAKVDVAIAKMQVDVLNGFAPSAKVAQIIALAKERQSITSDIRAYSYKADFETSQIFTTIVADKGELTDAYITELNAEIPDVETEFDKRSDLYDQLFTTAQQIGDLYASVSGLPPPTTGS